MIDEETLHRLREVAHGPVRPLQPILRRARQLRRRRRAAKTFAGIGVVMMAIALAGPQLTASRSDHSAEMAAGPDALVVPIPLSEPRCTGSNRRAQGAEADGLRFLAMNVPGYRLSEAYANTFTKDEGCFEFVNRLVLARLNGTQADAVLRVAEATVRSDGPPCGRPGKECVTIGGIRADLFAPAGEGRVVVNWTRPDGVTVQVSAAGVPREEVLRFAASVAEIGSLADRLPASPPGYTSIWSPPGELPSLPATATLWTATYAPVADGGQPPQLHVQATRTGLPAVATRFVEQYETVEVRGHPAMLSFDTNGSVRGLVWEEEPGLLMTVTVAGTANRELLLQSAESLVLVGAKDPRIVDPTAKQPSR